MILSEKIYLDYLQGRKLIAQVKIAAGPQNSTATLIASTNCFLKYKRHWLCLVEYKDLSATAKMYKHLGWCSFSITGNLQ